MGFDSKHTQAQENDEKDPDKGQYHVDFGADEREADVLIFCHRAGPAVGHGFKGTPPGHARSGLGQGLGVILHDPLVGSVSRGRCRGSKD